MHDEHGVELAVDRVAALYATVLAERRDAAGDRLSRAAVSAGHHRLRPLGLEATTQGTIAQRGALSMVGLLAQGDLRFATSWLIGVVAGKVVLGTVAAAMSMGTLLALRLADDHGERRCEYIARARGAQDGVELNAVTAHFHSAHPAGRGWSCPLLAFPLWATVGGGLWSEAWAVSFSPQPPMPDTPSRAVSSTERARWRARPCGTSAVPPWGWWCWSRMLLLGVRGPALLGALALSYAVYALGGLPRGVDTGAALSAGLRSELDQVVFLGVAGSVASSGFLQIAMIVAKNLDAAEAGRVRGGGRPAPAPASLLLHLPGPGHRPALARAWSLGDKALFRSQTDQATRVLVLAMVTVFGSMILCSSLVMSLWGAQFDAENLVFPLLLLAILASNLATASVNAMATRSKNLMQLSSGASLIGLAVGALVWLLVVPVARDRRDRRRVPRRNPRAGALVLCSPSGGSAVTAGGCSSAGWSSGSPW